MKKIVLFSSILLFSFSNISSASFYMTTTSCDNISGVWTGSGTASNWVLNCHYHGEAIIKSVNQSGQISLDIKIDKDSGSLLCPNHETAQLMGFCQAGQMTILTNYGNLNGNIVGNRGSAKGKLSLSPGLSANVTIELQHV
jgi:hypothetical protein